MCDAYFMSLSLLLDFLLFAICLYSCRSGDVVVSRSSSNLRAGFPGIITSLNRVPLIRVICNPNIASDISSWINEFVYKVHFRFLSVATLVNYI